LTVWQLFRTFPDNAVAACDEEPSSGLMPGQTIEPTA
jgi:hypothetical protein